MGMEDIKNEIRQFILTNYLSGEPPSSLQDNTPLQTSGILDSLAVLELASFIHKEFSVKLSASETEPDHFDRLADIVALVAERRRGLRRAS